MTGCVHPADALTVTSVNMTRDVGEIWVSPTQPPITIPKPWQFSVDVRCTLCGQGITLGGYQE